MNSAYAAITIPSLLTSNANTYRIVCWGVKVTVTSSVPNTQGQAIFSTLENPLAVSSTYSIGLMDAVDVQSLPLATGATFTWISKPCGSDARTFVGLNTNTQVSNNWTALLVDASGGAANGATILTFEYCYNIEFQPTISSGLAHIAPQDPPANQKLIEMTSRASNNMPHVVTGPLDVVREKAKHVATSVAAGAASKALELFGEMAMGLL